MTKIAPQQTKLKMLVICPACFLVMLALLLIPAGTWHYWQGWFFSFSIIIISLFIGLYFLQKNPQFIARRMQYREKEKTQKGIISSGVILFIAGFILAGLDQRYQWTRVSLPLFYLGAFLLLGGYYLVFLSFKENSYAARTVEIFEDHKLIDTGPYGIVRHPMYTGTIIIFLTTPLLLNSYIALIPFSLLSASIILRIFNKEKVLKEGLPGYKDYCQKFPYRLIPYVW